jgi:hypothetical protein
MQNHPSIIFFPVKFSDCAFYIDVGGASASVLGQIQFLATDSGRELETE